MNALPADFGYESLRRLLVEFGPPRTADEILSALVTRVARLPGVVEARVWLVRAGDRCAACPMQARCPVRTTCLHLVCVRESSDTEGAVTPCEELPEPWRDGRLPLGVGAEGEAAAHGRQVVLALDADRGRRAASLRGSAGGADIHLPGCPDVVTVIAQPLVSRGDVIGVLGVHAGAAPESAALRWLALIAEHAAAAVAMARAFDETERMRRDLQRQNEYLQEEVRSARAHGEIVGESEALQRALGQVQVVGRTDTTVLILGESGTGKELFARAIHGLRTGGRRPMVTVNCAAVPRELFESEFFGHVRGAFTGATNDRAGRFELADGGTLFLDEVGEIPIELQSKLLRALEIGEIQRVGEERTRSVSVRIVAATNQDLRAAVDAGRFRRDLYYRLSVFPIELPPLRERVDDIPLLARHLLSDICRRLNVRPIEFTQAQFDSLREHAWPGNVRELQNVIERAVIQARAGVMTLDIPAADRSDAALATPGDDHELLTYEQLREVERRNAARALEHTKGRIYGPDGAAALLGIKPTTFAYRLKTMGLRPERG